MSSAHARLPEASRVVSEGRQRSVAVIGAGITGLAAAHRLCATHPALQVSVLESEPRPGGVLDTVRDGGFLLEQGPDNFITQVPAALDLCRQVGLEAELIEPAAAHRQAFVVRGGRLRKIPAGFVIMAPGRLWPMLATPILSPLGKLRLAWECFVPPGPAAADESLRAFAVRRFGRQTYERLIQPLVGGIYTGDPDKLSLQATLPRFHQLEQEHGSLIRAALRQPRSPAGRDHEGGARYGLFVTPRRGMAQLVEAILARLPPGTVELNCPLTRLDAQPDGGWRLTLAGRADAPRSYDAVLLATPAPVTARLLAPLDHALGADLRAIHHARCATVWLAYRRAQIAHPLDGFGLVVPHVERRRILSASFASIKYPDRAPEGFVLIRVFLGGALQPELAELPPEDLRAIATRELAQLLGIRGEPALVRTSPRPYQMPQYELGHQERVARIRTRVGQLGRLRVAGNAYNGVGIPQCIQSGQRAADDLVAVLAATG